MNNNDSSFKDFYEIKKCRLKIDLVSSKEVFRQYMVVLYSRMAINDEIYRVSEKIAVSSCFT